MSKQMTDAYIVAATRTPIGKSGRGYYKNTRPDDLLLAALRGALGASRAVERMTSFGSTAPARVADQIAVWQKRLA